MKAEKLITSGKTSNCTTSSEVDLSPQYSTKSLGIRTLIVQLVGIEVIPDKLHGVYQ